MKSILTWLSILTTVIAIRVPTIWHPPQTRQLKTVPTVQNNRWVPINPKNRHSYQPNGRYGAIQPQVVFNPFGQITTKRPHHQTAKSINSFFDNFNVNQFIQSQKPLPVPQLNAVQRFDTLPPSFNSFNIHSVLQNQKHFPVPVNHKSQYAPIDPIPTFQFPPKQQVLTKNYRDDKTHEPSFFDREYDREKSPTPERGSNEKAPVSDHENPDNVPTKPIYPGEGQWAKKGLKHKPYISNHKYENLKETKPDGYETFAEGDANFDKKRQKFHENLNSLPVDQNLGSFLPSTNQEDTKDEAEEETDEFVPTKLYAQVRHSEDEEHLPAEADDHGKLKELIRDSKVQTVYSEEGYEDSAYDHAGHEKEAEEDEGFEDVDRELEEEQKKKIPKKKYVPLRQSVEYTSGDGLFTDEEIERDKKEKLELPDDADTAPSQYETGHSDNVLEEPVKKSNKNDFITSKKVTTMTTKDKGNGTMEMEVNGEMNIVAQPNNTRIPQKFVKKYPTFHKMMIPDQITTNKKIEPIKNVTEIYIEEVFNYTTQPSLEPTEETVGDSNLEIPITTLATTAIPKTQEPNYNPNPMYFIDTAYLQSRSKRSVENFLPKIEIDTEFITKINHTLGTPKKENLEQKYPYYQNYKEMGLNENSPLRYAENMNAIPKKESGKMTFYEQAESKRKCPEIASTVEPIPERILNAENAEENDEDDEDDDDDEEEDAMEGSESVQNEDVEMPSLPRLNGLGDKIDCLKARYFGENPLDSPFFKEETVGEVKPVFNFGNNKINKNNFFKSNDNINKNTLDSSEQASEQEITKTNTSINSTVAALVTTPSYTVKLEPKNIYDQIQLLNYLPDSKNKSNVTNLEINNGNSTAKPSIRIETKINIGSSRSGREMVEDVNKVEVLPEAEQLNRPRRVHVKRKRPPFQIFDINKFLPTTIPPYPHHLTTTPKAQLIRRYQYKRKGPLFQIFDVNKFLPTTTPIPVFHNVLTTVLPKYKVLSEVFYKDNIKPNEQLHVFTDVLNNIKSASEEQLKIAEKEKSDSETEANNIHSTTVRNKDDSYVKPNSNQHVDKNYYSSVITTTIKPIENTLYRIPNQPQRNNLENEKHKLYLALKDAILKQRVQTSSELPQNFDRSTEVMGLMPPKVNQYKTIHTAKRENMMYLAVPGASKEKVTNKFYVIGMKPPPQQRVQVYSDFLINNNKNRVRIKRSPNKPPYAQLSRGSNNPVATTEAPVAQDTDDDYVPHRPKNYYYDEKLGKIVYLNTKKDEDKNEDEEEELVEVVYEEITEASTTFKPKQNPIFATATPPPEGQSYVDFINKVKSFSNYKDIPDPEPTEKNQDTTTTTTQKPLSTTPPEFLSILAKVRQSNDYKQIEDEDEKKKNKENTTETPDEEIKEEEEEQDNEEIKNSAGMQITQKGGNFGIFDINDFIPKIKNYLPKTSIDTSKYQNIQRQPVKIDSETENTETKETEILPSTTTTTTTESTEPPTTVTSTTITSNERKLLKPRGRFRRPTTARTTRTTLTTPTPTVSEVTPSTTTESYLRQNFRRGRGRTTASTTIATTTTEKYIFDEKDENTKVLRRRSDPQIQQEEPQNGIKEETTKLPEKASVVEVFKKFNPRRRHGGNYRSVNVVEVTTERNKDDLKTDAEVISTYDVSKKHGGNYRNEQELIDTNNDSSASNSEKKVLHPKPVSINSLKKDFESKPKRTPERKPSKSNDIPKKVLRLADVVLKPESFYSDPTLASTVNQMVEQPRAKYIENISYSSEENDSSSATINTASESGITTTEPVFIKDPSKRLYYYALI